MEDLIIIKSKMEFLKGELRQTKFNFCLTKARSHVLGEERKEQGEEEEEEEGEGEKGQTKVCFCLEFIDVLDS